jgi:hypothetical protein
VTCYSSSSVCKDSQDVNFIIVSASSEYKLFRSDQQKTILSVGNIPEPTFATGFGVKEHRSSLRSAVDDGVIDGHNTLEDGFEDGPVDA